MIRANRTLTLLVICSVLLAGFAGGSTVGAFMLDRESVTVTVSASGFESRGDDGQLTGFGLTDPNADSDGNTSNQTEENVTLENESLVNESGSNETLENESLVNESGTNETLENETNVTASNVDDGNVTNSTTTESNEPVEEDETNSTTTDTNNSSTTESNETVVEDGTNSSTEDTNDTVNETSALLAPPQDGYEPDLTNSESQFDGKQSDLFAPGRGDT